MDYTYLIRLRRATTTAWDMMNPILSDGEPGYTTDINKYKIGDGKTKWKDLPWATGEKGDAATISVGDTVLGPPGTAAIVTNSGDSTHAIFDFVIPKGDQGEPGPGFIIQGVVDADNPLPAPPYTTGGLWVAGGTPPAGGWPGGLDLVEGEGLFWDGSAWYNVGMVKGPKGDKGDPQFVEEGLVVPPELPGGSFFFDIDEDAPVGAACDIGGLLTTKGDLAGRNSAQAVRVPVGPPGSSLTADLGSDTGVSWSQDLNKELVVPEILAGTGGFLITDEGSDYSELDNYVEFLDGGIIRLHLRATAPTDWAEASAASDLIPVQPGTIYYYEADMEPYEVETIDNLWFPGIYILAFAEDGSTIVGQRWSNNPQGGKAAVSYLTPPGTAFVQLRIYMSWWEGDYEVMTPHVYTDFKNISFRAMRQEPSQSALVETHYRTPDNRVVSQIRNYKDHLTLVNPIGNLVAFEGFNLQRGAPAIGNGGCYRDRPRLEEGYLVSLFEFYNSTRTADLSLGEMGEHINGKFVLRYNIPVEPNSPVTVNYDIKTEGDFDTIVYWYKTNEGPASTSASITLPRRTGAGNWLSEQHTVVAPPDASFCKVRIRVFNPLVKKQFFLRKVGVWAGAGGKWAYPGTPIQGLGTRWDETAGRRLEVWDSLNQRWQTTYYDSGWREMASLLETAAGYTTVTSMRLRRFNSTATLNVTTLARTSPDTVDRTFLTIPVGFRPSGGNHAYFSSFEGKGVMVLANGIAAVRAPAAANSFAITWQTSDAYPTTLPGTAVGTVPL